MTDPTHDPLLTSWVESANRLETDFPIQNLPYCTFRGPRNHEPHLGVAIGDQVLDVTAALRVPSMKAVMALPKWARTELRARISQFLAVHTRDAGGFLIAQADAELLLPCEIGDYTDFYASIHHATNVGSMFRPDNPLLPNYKWLPVGYHGRASSIVPSGTAVRRPWGQTVENPAGPPAFAPSRRLDYELEVGAFLGPGNEMGEAIPAARAGEHLFGVCLLNDWSALGKSVPTIFIGLPQPSLVRYPSSFPAHNLGGGKNRRQPGSLTPPDWTDRLHQESLPPPPIPCGPGVAVERESLGLRRPWEWA